MDVRSLSRRTAQGGVAGRVAQPDFRVALRRYGVGTGHADQFARATSPLAHLNVPSMSAGCLDPKVGRKESLESFTPLMNHVIDYNVWAVKARNTANSFRRMKAAPSG